MFSSDRKEKGLAAIGGILTRVTGGRRIERGREMDFDDNAVADEEMGLPSAGPSYEAPPGNSGKGADAARSWNRRVSGGGGRYRECLKNHAVSLGGHAVDGCGEFLAAGHEGTLDALRCAACSCHRNFHRWEAWDAGGSEGAATVGSHHQFSPYYRTPAGYLHHHMAATAAHHHHRSPPLALPSTSSGGGHGRDDQEDVSNPLGGGSGSGTKRFRTKFTPEQRDKMAEFGERVGWRIQKHDEAAVQQFCREACVKRHVLKVWMHNHKHTHGKKGTDSPRL